MNRRNLIIASITALLTFGGLVMAKSAQIHNTTENGSHCYQLCSWNSSVTTEAINE